MEISKAKTVETYIKSFPKDVQAILKKMRLTIKSAAPKAEERISYGVPSFRGNGNLVYYAAFKKHIGFYPPVPSAFKKETAKYAGPKGNLQFPLDEPIPYGLVKRIVKYKVKEDAQITKKK